jgi:hypothetical protein
VQTWIREWKEAVLGLDCLKKKVTLSHDLRLVSVYLFAETITGN